ncbi:hypothetical protein ACO0LF_31845, partial [Undibacterium sp. Di27W]|uniref:hypothetical protein n=1 Tax=Undibacterium sp. Di27W TaxID=3413036 RepID=UPI003BF12B2F
MRQQQRNEIMEHFFRAVNTLSLFSFSLNFLDSFSTTSGYLQLQVFCVISFAQTPSLLLSSPALQREADYS